MARLFINNSPLDKLIKNNFTVNLYVFRLRLSSYRTKTDGLMLEIVETLQLFPQVYKSSNLTKINALLLFVVITVRGEESNVCQAWVTHSVIPHGLVEGLDYQRFSSGHGLHLALPWASLGLIWAKEQPQDTTSKALAFSGDTQENIGSR